MNDVGPIAPASSALLVMDYQPAIIGRLEHGDTQVERAAAALELARGAGMQVGYVRVAFEQADADAVPPTNAMFAAAAAAMPADAPDTQIDERISPRDGDIVVRKTRVGAFSTTDLDAQLRARGVTTLVLTGISTSGVVLSTVRDAADRDYRLIVLADGCADRDEEVHRVLMTKVFPRQAAVLEIAELERALGAKPSDST
jgi:nicotinamidase-related amidase